MADQDLLEVCRGADAVYVQVHGLGSMHVAPALRMFADEMLESGCRRFVVDLSDCEGMDSTFMGVLLAIATWEGTEDPVDVAAINASDLHRRRLAELGLVSSGYVSVPEGDVSPPECELAPLDGVDTDHDDRVRLVHEVHERLVEAIPANRDKFGEFLRALDRELDAR